MVVPKSELKKVIKSDQINLRSHELAVPIFLARMFQNSPHYTSQRKEFKHVTPLEKKFLSEKCLTLESFDVWEPISTCVNHQNINQNRQQNICLHPHHIFLKQQSTPG